MLQAELQVCGKEENMDNSTPIFRSLEMIEERILEKLTAEKLAESVHFSKYHYQRLFRETVGESVMRYVTRRRLALAAAELAQTDASVLDIGLKYGYESHEGFSRSFKAFLGVTPMEYRKYHFAVSSPVTQKERCVMMYSKTTDEIIRELNGLIVQTRETAEYTRREGAGGNVEFYDSFWECIAARAESMAEELSQALERITAIVRQPDEITVRFEVIKAIEDAAFQANVAVLQINLTLSRAKPEHRRAYDSLFEKYNVLAQNAGMKAEKIAAFFNELAALIFQDMRKNAQQALEKTAEKGRTALGMLGKDFMLPYAYIADELAAITDELSNMALEEVTVSRLEDCLLRLDIVAFAADMDVLRAPSYEPLFQGIWDFKEQMVRAMALFQSLSWDASQAPAASEERTGPGSKKYRDLAFQEGILLFYLKGEIQKLGQRLSREQKADLEKVCSSLSKSIALAEHASGEEEAGEVAGTVRHVCDQMKSLADDLGTYGAPLRFLAEEVSGPVKYL